MSTENNVISVSHKMPGTYRFDIFKGVVDNLGRVHRVKSVGAAYYVDRTKTYNVYLKTFVRDVFYMWLKKRTNGAMDFVILTKEPARNRKTKYFWNSVGQGTILTGDNGGLVHLSWDLFGANDIYMNLHAKESYEALVIKMLREEVLCKKAA